MLRCIIKTNRESQVERLVHPCLAKLDFGMRSEDPICCEWWVANAFNNELHIVLLEGLQFLRCEPTKYNVQLPVGSHNPAPWVCRDTRDGWRMAFNFVAGDGLRVS